MHCAASFDRRAISRHVMLLGIDVEGSRCSSLMDEIRPHLLHMPGVKQVRGGSSAERRLILLEASLQEDSLPPSVSAAVKAAGGTLQHFDLKLGYDDLSTREVLTELLPEGVTTPSAYESVGHVVHLNLRPEQLPHRRLIGQVLLDKLRPRIRTVVNKRSEITGAFRNLPLELLAGDDDFKVTVQHGDASLSFDYSKVYWSSRLHTEHKRMAAVFEPGKVVWDLCAGVGPFAVLAARRGISVLANDLNPDASEAMRQNARQNRVLDRMHVYNLDAAAFVHAAVASILKQGRGLESARLPAITRSEAQAHAIEESALQTEAQLPDHILLNLPADSLRFLPALRPLQDIGGNPEIHCYSFSKAEDLGTQTSEARERISTALGYMPLRLNVRQVRSVAPGKEMLCYTFSLDGRLLESLDEPGTAHGRK